jgi:hypothetical protein
MRSKLFLFAALLLMPIVGSAQASSPTKAETVEWLNAHQIGSRPVKVDQRTMTVFRSRGVNQDTGRVSYSCETIIDLARLKSITVYTGSNKRIDLRGDTADVLPESYCPASEGQLTVPFNDDVSAEDIQRYAKALRHLAELNGATLAKDDIF